MKKFSFVYLPLLFLIYLVTETFLKLNHSSLCHSKGCELAGGLLNIPALWLNYIGIASVVILLVLGYLTTLRAFSKKYFFIFLSSMLMFETVMIAYQYFASPELCKFCLGVYSFLWLIALLTMRWKVVFLLPAVVAVLSAFYFLAIPKQVSFLNANGNYLIQSSTCPHCKKVKKFLDQNSIAYTKLDAKKIESREFVKFLGYKTIPVLLIKSSDEIKIINGDKDIINYFSHDKKVIQKPQEQTSPTDVLKIPSQDDGCGIDIFEEKSCDKK